MIKKAALVTTTVVCTLLLISLADHMFGDPHGLVLPRRSHFRYETTEFVFDVDTNALGFRDREVSPKREFRAIAIGDSFTYGWGVQLDQSWPKLLEKNLGIEVLNLGHPGASPIDYARTSEAAIPLLKPDLVIVAVLQGEDLSQIAFPPVPKRSISYLLTRIMDRAYPNTLDYLRRNARNHVTLKQEWQTLSIELFNDLSKTERDRFDRLDGRIRGKFFAGDLNPTLVQGGVVWPDYFYLGLDPHRPEIGKMAATWRELKQPPTGPARKWW